MYKYARTCMYINMNTYIYICIHTSGTIDLWALRFLVVREINCWDLLAQGCMPARQHCDLFYPLSPVLRLGLRK